MDIKDKKCLVIGGGKVACRKIETLLSYGADVYVISPEICPEIIDMLAEHGRETEASETEGLKTGAAEVGGLKTGAAEVGGLKTEASETEGRKPEASETGALKPEASETGALKTGPGKTGSVIRREIMPPEELEQEIRGCLLVVAASSGRETNHQAAMICHRLGIPVNVVDEQSECTFFFPAVVKKGDISIGINTGGSSPVVSARIRQEIEEIVPDYYADIARQLGQLRQGLKEKMPEEVRRRRFLKEVAARAFEEERPLTSEEIDDCFVETDLYS